jgi:putative ABC transport system substrate-binding protein
MNNKIVSVLFTLVIVGSFVLLKWRQRSGTSARYTIGILQTASHPALDAVREGFMHDLKQQLDDNVTFVIHNAQGSVAQAHALAQQFHADPRYSAFFTIATPATQAMVANENRRPIIIAAVTDPASLGLLQQHNVTGVSDMIDVKAELDTALQLVPHAQTIGLLYTTGEPNSLTLAQRMRSELEKHGRTVTDFTITNESDVAAIVALACRKVDLLIAPTDNMVASTIALIATITTAQHTPLIVSDNMLVQFGPLASRGIDYTEHGKHAAHSAHALLTEDKKPADLPVEQTPSKQIFINKATLEALGLTIPASLQAESVII